MLIKIEIDVKPEELRRFLGLPDIAGLQEDIIAFLRDKVDAASEFDPTGFVKSNIETLRNSSAWKNIVSKVIPGSSDEDDTPAKSAPRKSPRPTKPKSE